MNVSRYFEQFRGDEVGSIQDTGPDHERLDAEWEYGSDDWDDWDDPEDDDGFFEWRELKWRACDDGTLRLMVEIWAGDELGDDEWVKSEHERQIDSYPAQHQAIVLAERARVESGERPAFNLLPLLEDEDERWWRLDSLYDDVLPRPPRRPLAIPF